MIKLIEQNGNIDLTAPIVYKNPVKPYIDTSLITDWRYFFQYDYRSNWDLDNTNFSGGEIFYYCFNNSDIGIGKDIVINAPKATSYGYAFRMSHFRKVSINTTSTTDLSCAFYSAPLTEEVEFIGTTAKCTTFANCFSQCVGIRSIKGLDFSAVDKAYSITNALGNCASLENCIVTGKLKIYSNNFKISASTKLTRESVLSFAKAIENGGTATRTLYFGADNLAKLTDEEKAELTAKNFILA